MFAEKARLWPAGAARHLFPMCLTRGVPSVQMHPINIAAIPASVKGNLAVLHGVRWPERTPQDRRFVLAGSGSWYNLATPKPDPPDSWAARLARAVRPNHDHPETTPCMTSFGWSGKQCVHCRKNALCSKQRLSE